MLSPSQVNPIQIEWIREIVQKVTRDYRDRVGYDVGPECPAVQDLIAEEVQRCGAAWRARIEASVAAQLLA
jgi:hypothetical protein